MCTQPPTPSTVATLTRTRPVVTGPLPTVVNMSRILIATTCGVTATPPSATGDVATATAYRPTRTLTEWTGPYPRYQRLPRHHVDHHSRPDNADQITPRPLPDAPADQGPPRRRTQASPSSKSTPEPDGHEGVGVHRLALRAAVFAAIGRLRSYAPWHLAVSDPLLSFDRYFVPVRPMDRCHPICSCIGDNCRSPLIEPMQPAI